MKITNLAVLCAAAVFALCSCSDSIEVSVTDNVINPDYIGNGVEWDPYDEALSWGSEISEEDWQTIFERLDFMQPQYVRCMINSPFSYYDPETGKYDRERNAEYLLKLLGYCQDNGIMVVYGEYNPPKWSMKDSREWVRMSVSHLNWLVMEKGFDCIRHFIIFNEPDGNWASTNGDYKLWKKMAELFVSEMQKYEGLTDKVSLAGPDAVLNYRNPASEFGTEGWVANAAADLDGHIGLYDIHAYPGQHYVRSGKFAEDMQKIRALVPEGKQIIFGEAGYKYHNPEDAALQAEYDRRVEGHPFTKGSDCNMLVYDYFYALDMPLFLMEVMNNGFSGAAAWMLDDAMHSNGDSGKTEDIKIWGMWNILGSEVFNDPSQEEIRPWYYTWSMMCKYFPAGTDILEVAGNLPEGIHCTAGKTEHGNYSAAFVNLSDNDSNIRLALPDGAGKGYYLYTFRDSQNGPELEGPVPATVRNGKVAVELPAQSFAIVTRL